MEGRAGEAKKKKKTKNYTEVLEENDCRNVFNLKSRYWKNSLLLDSAAVTVLFRSSQSSVKDADC